mgnify:CR=1 FL=1
MYGQICIRPNIAYIIEILSRYLSNSKLEYWKAIKRFLRYLQKIKDYMLMYWRSNKVEIIGYTDSYYVGCQDSMKSILGYIYLLVGSL